MTMIYLFKKCQIWTKFQNGHDICIKTIELEQNFRTRFQNDYDILKNLHPIF